MQHIRLLPANVSYIDHTYHMRGLSALKALDHQAGINYRSDVRTISDPSKPHPAFRGQNTKSLRDQLSGQFRLVDSLRNQLCPDGSVH